MGELTLYILSILTENILKLEREFDENFGIKAIQIFIYLLA